MFKYLNKLSCALYLGAIFCLPSVAGENILLFGGLSYIDDETTPVMAAMLADDARGPLLEEGDAIIDFSFDAVGQVNGSGGLPNISNRGIVHNEDQAWTIATDLGATRAAGQLIPALQLYSEHVFGLLALANYEDVVVQTLTYSDPRTGERKAAKKRTYIVGVSALILDLDPETSYRRILMSSSDLGRFELDLPEHVDPTEAQKVAAYRMAYQNAISGALYKLRKAGDLDADRMEGRLNNMVTGFSMKEAAPAELMNYDLARMPTGSQYRQNMCTIPDGCTSAICRKRAAMLMHAFTSSLSEAGLPVLPPITAEYAGDITAGIELNLSLFGDASRLLGDSQSIRIDPADAATKWVVTWRGSRAEDRPNERYPDLFTNRTFTTMIGYVKGKTGFDGCTDVYDLQRDPPDADVDANSLGCAVETIINSQGEPGRGAERDFYTLSALDHVLKIGGQLTNERSSRNIECKPFAGADQYALR
ncbi:hypothetical protein HAD_06015 [Hyphomonas adhaerens MHS-3]|uniref:Uncharacterized protein n=1 Tax=Hyphomonas adhaerens MHS-3 TaxID=1280949 RepID=A0A069E5J9_9PROT|nr:hypothetical protein HAD_06015 [Hyphomonas adhaerens MHS-3]